MKKLLFVNACMRGASASRTKALADAFLESWTHAHPEWSVNEIDLTAIDLPIMTAAMAAERDAAVVQKDWASPLLGPALEFSAADRILIAAPTWDLSIPAALKVYIEWCSTMNLTFHYTTDGQCEGLSRADKLLYITTMGGPVEGQAFGIDYLRAISLMWGIPEFEYVAAPFTDVFGDAGEKSLAAARAELVEKAPQW